MKIAEHPDKNGTKRTGKILIGVWADPELAVAIDSAASRISFCDRSKYMRMAVQEKLSRDVMKLAEEESENTRIEKKVRRAIGNGKKANA